MNCDAAREFCDTELIGPLAVSGLNPYDLSKPCSGIEMDVCYPEALCVVHQLFTAIDAHDEQGCINLLELGGDPQGHSDRCTPSELLLSSHVCIQSVRGLRRQKGVLHLAPRWPP
jgi:hypothetical protein